MVEGLEAKALGRFDALVEKGDVIYSHRDPVHVPAKPYNVRMTSLPLINQQLQQASYIEYKLTTAKSAPKRSASVPHRIKSDEETANSYKRCREEAAGQ